MSGVRSLALVRGKIGGGDVAVVGSFKGGDFGGELAFVEVVGVGGDAGQSDGKLRLFERLARLVEVAVALEDAVRLGKLREQLGVEDDVFFCRHHEALAREPDGWSHHLRKAEPAIMFFGEGKACDRARGRPRLWRLPWTFWG